VHADYSSATSQVDKAGQTSGFGQNCVFDFMVYDVGDLERC
jgi:hypothetical protein